MALLLVNAPLSAAQLEVPATYATIQAAVNAAVDGDMVNIAAGTFVGQVTVTKAITLQGAGAANTIIKSPANGSLVAATVPSLRGTAAPRYAVLNLETATAGSGTVTVKNLTIDGNYEGFGQSVKVGTSTTYFIGIATFNTNALIDNVTVKHIACLPLDAAGLTNNGWGIGFGIMAEGGATLPTGGNPVGGGTAPNVTVTIQNSTIDTFQKTGIVAWGPKLNAVIANNHISGSGIYGNSGQNGMQIGSGGDRTATTATISGNTIDKLGAPDSLVAGGYGATGIYPVTAGAVEAHHNTITLDPGASANSLTGIDVSYTSAAANLHDNTFNNMSVGVQVTAPSTTDVHTITNNTLSATGGSPVVFKYDGDTGGQTITNFGTGHAIQVVGRNFSSGTVTTGTGVTVDANSVQMAVSGGNTTLYIDTDGVTDAPELQVTLAGVFTLANFSLVGEKINFAATAPTVSTGSATVTGSASATLAGTATNNGASTAVTFEYGTTTAYGSTVTATQSPLAAGSVTPSVSISATVSGLACGTAYHYRIKGVNTAGTSLGSDQTFTTSGCPSYDPPPNPTLPTGGGSASPSSGQTLVVTENGKDNSTINLPGSGGNNIVQVNLPGTGTISTSSTSSGTILGVTHVSLPGTATPVSAVTVDQGSASFTATKSGQAVAGLKNGIIVVSGSDSSKVTVDTTGGSPQIGVAASDTIIVPKGTQNVSGTVVDLPAPPSSGGSASSVTVKAGDQTITVQSSQSNTTMTFQVVDIGGVKTPVLAISGSAQVGATADNQPLVSVGGSVIHSGNSGTGSQKCNTIIQASSESSKDVVHVKTCYIILPAGTFSALSGGMDNGFAAIKDGIVWAGETAEFDKNGIVIGAYLGTQAGTSDTVGDDTVPGGAKFTASGYRNSAFIPRLAGTPLRLSGAKLDESIFNVVNQTLGTSPLLAPPSQSAQGILTFQVGGDASASQKAQAALTFGLSGDQVSVFPSRRIRVDTSRSDGVSVSSEGNVEVASGGLVTTFVPSVADPQGFAAAVATALPGATSEMRWNGSWQVTSGDGTAYVGRPQWGVRSAPSGATFSASADGNLQYSAAGLSQTLFPDFHDYTTLQATFSAAFKDPALKVLPRMDGTAQATVNGQRYTLAPQWILVKPAVVAQKPAWWVENGVIYLKNADGTAQGFTVR